MILMFLLLTVVAQFLQYRDLNQHSKTFQQLSILRTKKYHRNKGTKYFWISISSLSVKNQAVSILGFVGHIRPQSHIQRFFVRVFFYSLKCLKNLKAIFSSQTVQTQATCQSWPVGGGSSIIILEGLGMLILVISNTQRSLWEAARSLCNLEEQTANVWVKYFKLRGGSRTKRQNKKETGG